MPMTAEQTAEICASVKTWIGTPYVPKARVKGVGVDCGGLLYEVYNPMFGPFAPFPIDYPADWGLHQNNERYLDFIMPYVVEIRKPVVGGFSMFHLGMVYAHAAIFADTGNYIHAWGRLRDGSVTQTAPRILNYMAKQNGNFPVRHFEPK